MTFLLVKGMTVDQNFIARVHSKSFRVFALKILLQRIAFVDQKVFAKNNHTSRTIFSILSEGYFMILAYLELH